MSSEKLFGWQMAVASEMYLSILSSYMKTHGIERYFIALLIIHEHKKEGLSQQQLGELLKRDKVMVMRMIDYLESRGLVIRKEDPNDRRRHQLAITPQGESLLPKIDEAIDKTNSVLLEGLKEEEFEIFNKGMNKIMTNLDSLPESDFVVKAFRKKGK